MDPITQGAIGASFAQSSSKNKNELWVAAIVGCLGGMAPDLDVLIRSSTDPLLALVLHRHFTHSLLFIPLGGLIVAGIVKGLFFRKKPFRTLFLYATMGLATHGLVDACTAYGTLLLWPFSNARVSFDNMSIIDPLVTVPLIVGIVMSLWKKSKIWVLITTSMVLAYFALGFVQNARVQHAIEALSQSRGHTIERMRAMPSLGNMVVWRTIYEHEGVLFVDAVFAGWKKPEVFEGDRIQKLDLARDFPQIPKGSVQDRDIERFSWFASGWVAKHPNIKHVIIDVRYSYDVRSVLPIWGIKLIPETPNQHVENFSQPRTTSRSILPWKQLEP